MSKYNFKIIKERVERVDLNLIMSNEINAIEINFERTKF